MNKYCKEAVLKWGPDNQIGQFNEEMGELLVAVNQLYFRDRGDKDDVLEEIVDVRLMTEQLMSIFKISDEEYKKTYQRKIRRLQDQLEKGKNFDKS